MWPPTKKYKPIKNKERTTAVNHILKPLLALSLCLSFLSCQTQSDSHNDTESNNNSSNTTHATASTTTIPVSSSPNSELQLPAGFQAQLLSDGVGPARHLSVRSNGDIFIRLSRAQQGHCLAALRPSSGELSYFGSGECGTGLEVDDQALYYSTREKVFRQAFQSADELIPSGEVQTLVQNLGSPSSHSARSLALDNAGHLYVNVGAPSNACQERDRRAGSPGQDPCPLLQEFGGIYRFSSTALNQDKLQDGLRYATGIRNAVALAWNPSSSALYLLQHGRDQLNTIAPEHYSAEENAQLPAEEFARVEQGTDLGWPYCYYDPQQKKKVLGPEYGGDGQQVGRCNQFTDPLIGFPAHYAPNDLIFYTGSQFPESYRQGAFIAFHGSWNRSPLEQEGYQVVFVPMQAGKPAGEWEVFADGFAGTETINSPGDARYRPMGLAVTPKGDLLVIDSNQGRLWKISAESRT